MGGVSGRKGGWGGVNRQIGVDRVVGSGGGGTRLWERECLGG